MTPDQFTEAALRRSTYLDAAREADEGAKLFPDTMECATAIGALTGLAQRLRRLADHHTTAEQPTGPTWQTRADHATRLYARAEAARLRAERDELIQQRDRIAIDTTSPISDGGPVSLADAARQAHHRLVAVEQLVAGRPGYHTVTVKALLTAMGRADAGDGRESEKERGL
ncbi:MULTISPECIES: hypothetical protein [unclassified Streptomyces]|uniref:hypothetical protein n=1 Tax=unclassified Streptomyces TaxID=2593676 RepID=UPI001660B9EA|nr:MULTISPECIES: hypothetical protein [unclassified Streptomyces]MBD0707376.1 hypothetical protein [Streptomyces sp. CBMA291]MBD0715172.1 hypothetical protein [Streptomyces sp. CBMA370]